MKLFKKSLSVFIVTIMLLTSVSLQGFAGVTAKAASDNGGADGDNVTAGYKREHVMKS